MEWFWKMVDHLQKNAALSALQGFSPADWIIVIALLWGLLQGSRKGFSDMFGKLLGVFLVSMLTLSYYKGAAAYLNGSLPALSPEAAEPFSFFLLAVFLWLSISWCINVFGKFLKIEAQGILKTWGGMVLGVLRMLLLLSFLAQFLLLLPIEPVQQIFKQGRTYTGHAISRFAPALHSVVSRPFCKPVFKKPVEAFKVGG